jgi:hypothetical protein
MLALSVVERGFESLLGQTKDYENEMGYFSANNKA